MAVENGPRLLSRAVDSCLRREPRRIVLEIGGRSFTGRELLDQARAMAQRLAAPPHRLVALRAENGPWFLAAMLAIWLRDCAVALLDPSLSRSRAAEIAAALGAAASCSADPAGIRVTQMGGEAALASSTAVVKMTSGSSGEPRGVLTSGRALLADEGQLATTMGIRASDRILGAVPMSHSYGLSSVALPALVRGSRVLVPETDHPLAPLKLARDGGASVLPTVPAFLQAVVPLRSAPPLPSSLKLIFSAGAPLGASTAAAFEERFGHRVRVFYGASECGGITFDRTGEAALEGTLGTPVDGVEVFLDGDGGTEGSVCVRSPAVASGYLPIENQGLSDGIFRTSDRARWRGDRLELLGRDDDLINVRGRKVRPRRVEIVLERHPSVAEVSVFGLPVQGTDLVTAVVAARQPVERTAILDWCRRHLDRHEVPRRLRIVDTLPRTSRGKIDRERLRALAGP